MKSAQMRLPEEPGDVVWDERLKADISLYGRDRGTPQRHRHGEVIEVGNARHGPNGGTGRHAEEIAGNPLAMYYRKQLLSDSPFRHKRGEENEQRHAAALRFLADWERGGRRPRMVARLDGAVTISGRWHASADSDRWGPWVEAMVAMDRWGPCVQGVVCFDETAKSWAERRHRRMPRSGQVGMMVLRLGLERLVRWYAAIDKARR